jgi:MFS family permease
MTCPITAAEPVPSVVRALLPLNAAVLIAFLVSGLALPVLPLHIHDELGFGPVVVGVVAGCQFAASLVARIWSGHAADARGAKWAVIAGLVGATAAGLLYLLSLVYTAAPGVSVAVLLSGRALLGAAESFIITGATAWGLSRVGAGDAGKVIAWMGTAMFAGFAAGAPLEPCSTPRVASQPWPGPPRLRRWRPSPSSGPFKDRSRVWRPVRPSSR